MIGTAPSRSLRATARCAMAGSVARPGMMTGTPTSYGNTAASRNAAAAGMACLQHDGTARPGGRGFHGGA